MAMCITSSLLHVFDTSQVSPNYLTIPYPRPRRSCNRGFRCALSEEYCQWLDRVLVVTKDYNFFSILATRGKATFRSYSFTILEENVPAPHVSLLQDEN